MTHRLRHQLFSTKQFVPGHIVGTLILVFGTIAVGKAFIAHGNREACARLREGRVNARGQYGSP